MELDVTVDPEALELLGEEEQGLTGGTCQASSWIIIWGEDPAWS